MAGRRVHHRFIPSITLLVPIYTHWWGKTMWNFAAMDRISKTLVCPWHGIHTVMHPRARGRANFDHCVTSYCLKNQKKTKVGK